MKIDVLTLFPGMLDGVIQSSILQRACSSGKVEIKIQDIRDYTEDKHRTVDDRPFGGGPGMVMKCEPLVRAIEASRGSNKTSRVIYMTAEGKRLDQKKVGELSREEHLIFVSGHYEGIDERVREAWVDEELSIGDYVLTNGTIAAGVVIDSVVRLIPGVLGNESSAEIESFSSGLLEGPQYTRPEEFRGMEVPAILKTGNHEAIREWRHEQALKRTKQRRKDLLDEEQKTN